MYKNIFFDLDGTLLDTLNDIKDALNDALKANGIDGDFTYEDAKTMIGRGTDHLLMDALDRKNEKDKFNDVKTTYMANYMAYQTRKTKPFGGVIDVLNELKKHNIKLYVCTNKPDALAKIIVDFALPGIFDGVRGIKEGDPVKPDPFEVNDFVNKDGLDINECIFIGDSKPDLETANNARIPLCLAKWGYGDYDQDWVGLSKYVIDEPHKIIDIILGEKR